MRFEIKRGYPLDWNKIRTIPRFSVPWASGEQYIRTETVEQADAENPLGLRINQDATISILSGIQHVQKWEDLGKISRTTNRDYPSKFTQELLRVVVEDICQIRGSFRLSIELTHPYTSIAAVQI